MCKVTIVSYYELKESLLSAAKSLQNLGYIVNNYPLFRYAYDSNDKIINYKEHFAEFLNFEKPDIIIWWFINIPNLDFKYIIKSWKSYQILYNWDDPWTWNEQSIDLKAKSKYFDLVACTCEESLPLYLEAGAKNAIYLHPGFSPQIHKPLNIPFKNDISILCTNLYSSAEFNDQYINRKSLIDLIYSDETINFEIYGPEFLQVLYPRSYRGFVNYSDSVNIFNSSKINLCTHVCCSKSKYMNERCSLILGSGSLLLVDKVKDLDKLIIPDKECIILDINNPLLQIHNILNQESINIEIRKNALLLSKQFTWQTWADILDFNIKSNYFPQQYDDSKVCKNTIYKLNSKFSNLENSTDYYNIYNQLKKIESICNENPYLDINKELQTYFHT